AGGLALDLGGPENLSHRDLVARAARLLGQRGPAVLPIPRLLVNAWERLAIVHRIFERFDRAEFALDRARSVLDRERLPQTERGNWLYHRGALRYDQARYEDALADYARAFELHRDRDAKLPAGLLIHHALALFAAGDHAQAFEVVHKKLEQTAQTYGDQHPKYGQDCLVLGTLMVDNGALSAGLERLSRGIEILERYPGHKKAHVAKALATQARALNGLHRPAEAEPLARRAHERLTALPSPHLAAEVEALREQARAHQALGRISEALALYRRALARAEASQRLSGEADALREAITAGEAQLEEPAVAG
ncbi:MAG: tetratricopeptide repeat protein, partial [Myxococcota bacterium]